VRTLARARTLSVLERLDENRKARALRFLYEANLITSPHPIISLETADLRGADLSAAATMIEVRPGVNMLAPTPPTNWSRIDLSGSYLSNANLLGDNLRNVDLSRTHLYGSNLKEADLSDANLSGAVLGSPILARLQEPPEQGRRKGHSRRSEQDRPKRRQLRRSTCDRCAARATGQDPPRGHHAQRPEVRGLAQEQGPRGEREEQRHFVTALRATRMESEHLHTRRAAQRGVGIPIRVIDSSWIHRPLVKRGT
jgi:hypothetical protein